MDVLPLGLAMAMIGIGMWAGELFVGEFQLVQKERSSSRLKLVGLDAVGADLVVCSYDIAVLLV
jgi:hypothetical protein